MPGTIVLRFAVLGVAVLFAATPAAAATPGHDKPPHAPAQTHAPSHADITDVIFTELERRIICDYFKVLSCGAANLTGDGKDKIKGRIGSKDKSALLPPGLAKRDDLPPGLEKQYLRNGKLPPGLQKRSLPDGLAHSMPRRKAGYERVIVGDDVLLIQIATGVILDILEGVAARQ